MTFNRSTLVTITLILTFASVHAVTAATWVPGNIGSWTDPANWTPADVPDTPAEDAIIDGDPGSASEATLIRTSIDAGQLTIDEGDTLRFNPDANTLSVTGLSNSGQIIFGTSPTTNSRTGRLEVGGTGNTFNTSTGVITTTNNSGRNRINLLLEMDANNQNDGEITMGITDNADRDTVQFRLTNSGTFTNNGTITLRDTQSSSTSSAQFRLLTGNASVTLGGTGTLNLDTGTITNPLRARILGASAATPGNFTNAASHTIQGAGHIGSNLVVANDGLILGTSNTAAMTIDPLATFTNSSTGRLVASGTAGLSIEGGGGHTFTNEGLIESRITSNVSIDVATVTLNGTIRGSGTFTSTTLSLTDNATLEPGDSANANGTGASTVGLLSVDGDLALSNLTTLNFQLGDDANAGTTFDSIDITGTLTLDGELNIEALTGFGVGTYRLFTFASGNLIDNDLVLANLPVGFLYNLDANNAGGYVDLTVIPEPASLLLIGLGGMLLVSRRTRQSVMP